MIRFGAILLLMAAIGCGGEETSTSKRAVETTPPEKEAVAAIADEGRKALETLSPTAKTCLELVRAGQLAQAITPCTEAARQDPNDPQIQAALERVRASATERVPAVPDVAAGKEAAMQQLEDAKQQLTVPLP